MHATPHPHLPFSHASLPRPQVDFSEQCRGSLGFMQQRRLLDWRLDYKLRQACSQDVKRVSGGFVEGSTAQRSAAQAGAV